MHFYSNPCRMWIQDILRNKFRKKQFPSRAPSGMHVVLENRSCEKCSNQFASKFQVALSTFSQRVHVFWATLLGRLPAFKVRVSRKSYGHQSNHNCHATSALKPTAGQRAQICHKSRKSQIPVFYQEGCPREIATTLV